MSVKWLVRILVLAVVAGLGAWLLVLRDPPVPVRTVRVERGAVEATITNSKAGTVRARRRAGLYPEAGGRVVEVLRREGDRVEEGAVLIRLNDKGQQAAVRLARGQLRAAEAALAQSKLESQLALRELERARELSKQRVVSEQILDRLQSEFERSELASDAARAELARARAAIQAADAELEKTTIRAPFAGVLAEVEIELGEWIEPSGFETPPIDLIDTASLYVSAPMDEVDSALVAVGQRAHVTIDSFPGQRFPGRVARVAPYVLDVEAQNRTVEIEAELEDREFAATLLPGTSADVEVVLDAHQGVVRIPAEALLEEDHVLVIQGERLVEQPIRVGLRNWDHAEVLEGLEPEQEIVVSLDRDGVTAGAKVRVEEATPER